MRSRIFILIEYNNWYNITYHCRGRMKMLGFCLARVYCGLFDLILSILLSDTRLRLLQLVTIN